MTYNDYITGLIESNDRAAMVVKLADLRDNMKDAAVYHPEKLATYEMAKLRIENALETRS